MKLSEWIQSHPRLSFYFRNQLGPKVAALESDLELAQSVYRISPKLAEDIAKLEAENEKLRKQVGRGYTYIFPRWIKKFIERESNQVNGG